MRVVHRAGWLFALAVALGISGCRHEAGKRAGPPYRGVRLVLGVVGDPAVLATAAPVRGDWSERRGGEVVLREAPIEPPEIAAGAVDLVIFRGDRLGDLVDAGALAVLPESVVRPRVATETDEPTYAGLPGDTRAAPSDRFDFADVLPVWRDRVTRYGDDRMGLPYGGSALVLAYRRDAFTRAANRVAAKEAGVALEPPDDWTDLDALARFFHGRDWDGDGTPDAGIALALGPDPEGLALASVLARAASLGQHRDQYSFVFNADTLEPAIAGPPFVEALRDLTALGKSGPPGAEGFDAEAARAAFRSGKVALLIDRAERAARWTDPKHRLAVGVVPLPGSSRVYHPDHQAWEAAEPRNRPSYLPFGGGWLIGVGRHLGGVKREAALDLARDLAGPETSGRVVLDRAFPMVAARRKALDAGLPDPRSAPGVDPRAWGQAVRQTLAEPRVILDLRIPGATDYLADLDQARLAAVHGTPPEQALRDAARRWSDRSRKLGRQRQLWHYRRSLNTLVTDPRPPAEEPETAAAGGPR